MITDGYFVIFLIFNFVNCLKVLKLLFSFTFFCVKPHYNCAVLESEIMITEL